MGGGLGVSGNIFSSLHPNFLVSKIMGRLDISSTQQNVPQIGFRVWKYFSSLSEYLCRSVKLMMHHSKCIISSYSLSTIMNPDMCRMTSVMNTSRCHVLWHRPDTCYLGQLSDISIVLLVMICTRFIVICSQGSHHPRNCWQYWLYWHYQWQGWGCRKECQQINCE